MGLSATLNPTVNSQNENGENEFKDLNDRDFSSLTQEGMVFVDFWAEWCHPCKMVEPFIKKLAIEWKGKIRFGKLNVDDYPITPEKFGIVSIPTFYLFYKGEKVDEMVGAAPEEVFAKFLESNYKKYIESAV